MDSANPSSLRSRLLVRMTATLLALVLMYVLGVGPAWRIALKSDRLSPYIVKLYEPLFMGIEGTPLERPFYAYMGWWGMHGGKIIVY